MNNNIFEQGLAKYLTPEQIHCIQTKKIGIAGAGGLGSNIAVLLTRCGFKKFHILDKDVIEASNLNRQHFFLDEIGEPKVAVLKKRLLAINPDAKITTHHGAWTTAAASKYFQDCDVLVEAFDQALNKRDFVEYYTTDARMVVSGNGMAGCGGNNALCVQKKGMLFIVGDQQSDTDDGLPVLGPRVMICAAMMADVILNETLR